MTCVICDEHRQREGAQGELGKPCDICNDTGKTYLGDKCRHGCTKPTRTTESLYTRPTRRELEGRVHEYLASLRTVLWMNWDISREDRRENAVQFVADLCDKLGLVLPDPKRSHMRYPSFSSNHTPEGTENGLHDKSQD